MAEREPPQPRPSRLKGGDGEAPQPLLGGVRSGHGQIIQTASPQPDRLGHGRDELRFRQPPGPMLEMDVTIDGPHHPHTRFVSRNNQEAILVES